MTLVEMMEGLDGVNASPLLRALVERVDVLGTENVDLRDRVAWLEMVAAGSEGLVASAIAEVRSALTDLHP